MIEQLEADASSQLATITGTKARARAVAALNGSLVEVFARRTHRGTVAFGYGYCGVRLERRALLLLICPETACPKAEVARELWRQRLGQKPPQPTRAASRRLEVASLFVEVPVEAGNRACVARPASFVCLTPCPVGAHAPAPLKKAGWDLFEGGRFIAGGLNNDVPARPVFPSITAVGEWLEGQPPDVEGSSLHKQGVGFPSNPIKIGRPI
jgi:hypothetical protein